MNSFFTCHPVQHSFQLFSVEHLVTLAIIVIIGAFIFLCRKQLRKKMFVFILLSLILIASETAYQALEISCHQWSAETSLPLQLSDIVVLLAAVMLITKSRLLFYFVYFAGISSSVQAMITPDLGGYAYAQFRYVQFYVSHGGVVLACCMLIAVCRYEPTFRSLWVSVVSVNLYGGFIYAMNRLLGANYLYMMKKPEHASLLDVLGPHPWYLVWIEGIMILSFLVLYLPFWVHKKIKGDKNKVNFIEAE
ncbi:TIGR02206 family membrane protein [Priestia megaterium]|uniref:YwaF family protein n=1 Tax=Priestia megaterium TaxID=1404 RepID=UPI001B3A18D4|nr:TIGR02206 family membrane protein [Priestia megaterium]MBQ4865850.1 TIGR02206 family membrane protein [Priestia megaterium]